MEEKKFDQRMNWLTTEEMKGTLEFMAFEESQPGRSANVSSIVRRLVENSPEYKRAVKRSKERSNGNAVAA